MRRIVEFSTGLAPISRQESSTTTVHSFLKKSLEYIAPQSLGPLYFAFVYEELERSAFLHFHPCQAPRAPLFIELPFSEMPEWALTTSEPFHVMLRRFYKELTEKSGAGDLWKEWARQTINLDEVLTGFLAKQCGHDAAALKNEHQGHFDSSAQVIQSRYAEPDMGLSSRFTWVGELKSELGNSDFEKTEQFINGLRWRLVEELQPTDTFSVNFLVSYYLKLRIKRREQAFSAKNGEALLTSILEIPTNEASL